MKTIDNYEGIKKTIWLLLGLFFIFAGCQQVQSGKEDLLAVEPNVAALVVPGDYASSALAATGGVVTWTKTIKAELDGVVTFYQQDNSLYLTEHNFEVYPWSNSIQISGQEPETKFVCQSTAGQFSVLKPSARVNIDKSGAVISNSDYTEAVLMLLTAPVRFFDKGVGFNRSSTPVRKEGLWYYQIEMNRSSMPDENRAQPYWSKVVFYQNTDLPGSGGQGGLVDMIWLANPDSGKFFAVRGYDYKMVREDSVLVPAKIEIFRTDSRGLLKERLVKIDFKKN